MPNLQNKNAILPKMNTYMTPCQQCGANIPTQFTPAASSPTQMPTGIPTGPLYSSPIPVQQSVSATASPVTVSEIDTVPQTVMDIQFTQGYLKTQIGRHVKVEFLVGTSMFIDKEGILVDVGTSYIIIRETETDDLLLCDMYSIKFVRFYY
jgi:hypothetical protein